MTGPFSLKLAPITGYCVKYINSSAREQMFNCCRNRRHRRPGIVLSCIVHQAKRQGLSACIFRNKKGNICSGFVCLQGRYVSLPGRYKLDIWTSFSTLIIRLPLKRDIVVRPRCMQTEKPVNGRRSSMGSGNAVVHWRPSVMHPCLRHQAALQTVRRRHPAPRVPCRPGFLQNLQRPLRVPALRKRSSHLQ